MNAGWTTYRLLAPALGAVAPVARWFTSPHERALWNERLGDVPAAGECDAWIHAASLGEATGVGPLVAELTALQPGARLHVSASTRTGRSRLAGLGLPVSLAPFDAPQTIERFLARVRPRRIVLVETELWPHWLLRARALGVPVIVVSGRLSTSSVTRYRRLGSEFESLVRDLSGVVAQTPADVERWRAIGARPERIAVGGNLKHDALPEPAASRGQARAAMGLDRERPLLVLGSLRPGEARMLARAWRALPPAVHATWQVVAVPRHVHATSELREEVARAGRAGAGHDSVAHWRWDDRPGVLAGYYAGAEVAFVGGSLVPRGGHNPLEPAACGAAIVMGPHHAAQLAAVRALEDRDAITVVRGPRDLEKALTHLLQDAAARDRRGAAAREAARALRGGARRTAAQLAAWNLWPVR